jgi:hypothetical protein
MPDDNDFELVGGDEPLALQHRFAIFLIGNIAAFAASMMTEYMYTQSLQAYRNHQATKSLPAKE